MTIDYTISINKILDNTPELENAHSLVFLYFIGIKSKQQGYQLFELGKESVSTLIRNFHKFSIYGKSAIIHSLGYFLANKDAENKIFYQLSEWLSTEKHPIQYVILHSLANSSHKEAIKIVKPYLNHPNKSLESAAISTLSKLDTRAVLTYLMLAENRKDKQRELEDIIINSQKSNVPLPHQHLLALMSMPYDNVRTLTIERLVTSETFSIDELFTILEDKNFIVRKKSLYLLEEKLEPNEASDILVNYIFDRNKDVVKTATFLLKPHISIVYSRLIDLSTNAKGYSLYAIFDLVKNKKEERLIDVFGKALQGKCQVSYRKRILKWLIKQDSFDKIKPYLIIALRDENTEVSEIARTALDNNADEDSIKHIIDSTLETNNTFETLNILEKTKCLSRSNKLAILKNTIDTKPHHSYLGRISELVEQERLYEILPNLREAQKNATSLHKEKYESIILRIESFGMESGRANHEGLKTQLESHLKSEILTALEWYETNPSKELLDKVRHLLFHTDKEVRTVAANCLKVIQDESIADELRRKLSTHSNAEKQYSAEALAIVGNNEDVDLIARSLYSDSLKGPDTSIAELLISLGWTQEDITKKYRIVKIESLFQHNQDINLERSTQWERADIITTLEFILEGSKIIRYFQALNTLKSLNWSPTEPHFILLNQLDSDTPKIKPLTEYSSKWIIKFCTQHYTSPIARKIILTLAISGEHYRQTMMSCMEAVKMLDITDELLELKVFSESDVRAFLSRSENSSIVFGFKLAAHNSWYSSAALLQEHFDNFINQQNSELVNRCVPYIAYISPDFTESAIINVLSENTRTVADHVCSTLLNVLFSLSGRRSTFLYLQYMKEMNKLFSRQALSVLTRSGWKPRSIEDEAIKRLVNLEHSSLSQVQEGSLDYAIQYLHAGNECTLELLEYFKPYLETPHGEKVIDCLLKSFWSRDVTVDIMANCLVLKAELATEKLLSQVNREKTISMLDHIAVRLLCQVGTTRATPFFITIIESGSSMFTRDAVDAISRLKDQDAVPALIALVPRIRDKNLYSAIIKCLAKIPCEVSMNFLLEVRAELTTKTLIKTVESALKRWKK